MIRDRLHVAATKAYPDTVFLHLKLPVPVCSSPAIVSENITLCPFLRLLGFLCLLFIAATLPIRGYLAQPLAQISLLLPHEE